MEAPSSNARAWESFRIPLADSFGRIAKKLRISVTDRCNFRCSFCMPEDPQWLPYEEILSYEEITRVASVMAKMGVSKIRLSGGEPLVRREIERLVGMLSSIPEVKEVSMTTNGALLEEKAQLLKEKGLRGITVSLHSLKPERYHAITGTRDVFTKVLRGIEKAKEVGLSPLKINCVVTKGCNDDELLDFAQLAHDGEVVVRFIEYMPFDGRKLWDTSLLVSGREILERIGRRYQLIPLPREHGSTAQVYRFADGSKGEIGIITSMTEPFCGDCDRIRLKADGKIVPCLFSTAEYDIKGLLRSGASDEELAQAIRDYFWRKSPGVESMLKERVELKRVRPMYTIGG